MDSDFVLYAAAGGAIIAASLALARLLLEYGLRGGERRIEHDERRGRQMRDAEARLERILQDRLADADRRLERCQADLRDERVRSASLEAELLRAHQAFELLKVQYAALTQADEGRRLSRGT